MPIEIAALSLIWALWAMLGIKSTPAPKIPKTRKTMTWSLPESNSQFATMAWMWKWKRVPHVGETITVAGVSHVLTNVELKSKGMFINHLLLEWGGGRDGAPDEEGEYEYTELVA